VAWFTAQEHAAGTRSVWRQCGKWRDVIEGPQVDYSLVDKRIKRTTGDGCARWLDMAGRRTRGDPHEIPWTGMAGNPEIVRRSDRSQNLTSAVCTCCCCRHPFAGCEKTRLRYKLERFVLLLPLLFSSPLSSVLCASPWAGERSKYNPSLCVFRILAA